MASLYVKERVMNPRHICNPRLITNISKCSRSKGHMIVYPPVVRGTRVATISVKIASLFAKESIEPKACTLKCDPKVVYMTCPSSGLAKLYQVCVTCCTAGEGYKGCNYYSANGAFICEGQSDPKNPKACPLNCDPHIAYSKCPRSRGKTLIYPAGCTTCCMGYKGCYYFGKIVCEGESIEPKACILECDSRVAYMTCPSSGLAELNQICVNCCTAGEGCKLYGHDGSLICTGESQSYISTI
ncbi:hypothetical protein H5410_027934 [Solanum commersonii]|uniref:Proteinase inhibitor type-2 CEVI57 n=1 Tax=Solanum commersonii TaxID=4109 RepID=A0A9J5Z183_SOLCO|nr:hypothetical protein H5410_027934 [Solanum commersonii]